MELSYDHKRLAGDGRRPVRPGKMTPNSVSVCVCVCVRTMYENVEEEEYEDDEKEEELVKNQALTIPRDCIMS